MVSRILLLLILVTFVSACYRAPRYIEPTVKQPPHAKEIHREKRTFLYLPEDFSLSPFPPLTAEEALEDWGKEYQIALAFSEDFDLYRAITGFKRSLYFLPKEKEDRYLEIEYAITLAYFLGKKYIEAIYTVESSKLASVDDAFPAFSDLLLILYDSYEQVGKKVHAQHILKLIDQQDTNQARRLMLLAAVKEVDFEALQEEGRNSTQHAYLEQIVCNYQKDAKSVRKAEFLNAVLPGAGYWYVGLRGTAVSAFIVNSLFVAAATHFFLNGNTAAGAIILSLEGGWYFGGIYGAGLAAKYYNERLYCSYAEKITQREQLFPLMMLKYTF